MRKLVDIWIKYIDKEGREQKQRWGWEFIYNGAKDHVLKRAEMLSMSILGVNKTTAYIKEE